MEKYSSEFKLKVINYYLKGFEYELIVIIKINIANSVEKKTFL